MICGIQNAWKMRHIRYRTEFLMNKVMLIKCKAL